MIDSYPHQMDPRDRRTASAYDDVLTQQAHDVAIKPGASGYFSRPDADLDPRLFDGKVVRPAVRRWVLDTLFSFWAGRGLRDMQHSAHVWFAGSGITYQWAAQRDPGDLDVLIGLNTRAFVQSNQQFAGKTDVDIATALNAEMRTLLWPTTSNWKGLEVTFYINPGAQDIHSIHPYAAYDVSQNHWTVLPPALGPDYDPDTAFPDAYVGAVAAERDQATQILDRYHRALGDYHDAAANPARQRNAQVALRQAIDQGAALFNSIHSDRHMAFSQQGQGYRDYFNYRWQAHKRSGVVPALHALAALQEDGWMAWAPLW